MNTIDESRTKETCDEYSSVAQWAMLMNDTLGYIIVGVNFIIRTVMIMLLSWIGYSSETVKLARITNFTFYMLFFNTAFLLMLVNADLSE